MGVFIDVFRVLCDEAYIVSSKEFAMTWNRRFIEEKSTINESTVNRWKDETLTRRFYLPRIVSLFGLRS